MSTEPTDVEQLVRRLTAGEPLPELSPDERHHAELLLRACKAGLVCFTAVPHRRDGVVHFEDVTPAPITYTPQSDT